MQREKEIMDCAEQLSWRQHGLNLFLVGFLVLFLELACIRWFSAYVIFLQFFTNVVLIACFLGMSCGCLTARLRRDWLGSFCCLAALLLGASPLPISLERRAIGLYDRWS
jgi:hypothetical protein